MFKNVQKMCLKGVSLCLNFYTLTFLIFNFCALVNQMLKLLKRLKQAASGPEIPSKERRSTERPSTEILITDRELKLLYGWLSQVRRDGVQKER